MRFPKPLAALAIMLLGSVVLSAPQMARAELQLLHKVPRTPPAPDFELPDLDGEKKKLSDYRGKVVLINFWATWCPPCRKEIPSMQRAWKILEKRRGIHCPDGLRLPQFHRPRKPNSIRPTRYH